MFECLCVIYINTIFLEKNNSLENIKIIFFILFKIIFYL